MSSALAQCLNCAIQCTFKIYLNVSYYYSNYCKWIYIFELLITGLFQEKFGDDIDIRAGKKKIGTKHADDYSSGADTDDLANDSDLDVDTCRSNNDTIFFSIKGHLNGSFST